MEDLLQMLKGRVATSVLVLSLNFLIGGLSSAGGFFLSLLLIVDKLVIEGLHPVEQHQKHRQKQ